eukprot:GILK01015211.1.p1 GENE.GILK01015211.1~~GILK01015211.1.p1  ORF type:complete len:321 (+),score=43.44 GILK01015211.1:68-1030(+)
MSAAAQTLRTGTAAALRREQVTIFGGTGFLGHDVVESLAPLFKRVRIAVRNPTNAKVSSVKSHVHADTQIEAVKTDISDHASVLQAAQGSSVLVNLVGILYGTDQQFYELQALGPKRVAEAAQAVRAERFVHISAIGADASSDSVYQRTKGLGEVNARAVFAPTTVLRPSILFGPRDNFFNQFASMAALSPALPLIGGGNTRFQPVYVKDVAAAIAKAIELPETQGKTYELGGPHIYTFKQIMELVLKYTGRKRLLIPIPWPIAQIQGAILGCLPHPLLTSDQVKMLRRDNVVRSSLTLSSLGITAKSVEEVVPSYLTPR